MQSLAAESSKKQYLSKEDFIKGKKMVYTVDLAQETNNYSKFLTGQRYKKTKECKGKYISN